MKLSSRKKPQPSCFFAEEATHAFVSPIPLLSKGKGESGLPLAPWAVVVCWWSPELETHCKRVFLLGEAGFGMTRPCLPRPQHSTLSQRGRSAPRAHLKNGPKLASGSGILESETSLREQTSAPRHLCSGSNTCLCLP